MEQLITLREDMCVLLTHPASGAEIRQIVSVATRRELQRLCFVVAAEVTAEDTARMLRAIAEATAWAEIEVYSGIETYLLNERGRAHRRAERLADADFTFLSTQRLPIGSRTYLPRELVDAQGPGPLALQHAILVSTLALARAVSRYPHAILADLFRPFPELGLVEEELATEMLDLLVEAAERSGAAVLINERYRCPSSQAAQRFLSAGVPLFSGSGASWPEAIGRYTHVRAVHEKLVAPD